MFIILNTLFWIPIANIYFCINNIQNMHSSITYFQTTRCLQNLLSGQTEMTQFWPIKQIQLVCILYIIISILVGSCSYRASSTKIAEMLLLWLVVWLNFLVPKHCTKYNNCMQCDVVCIYIYNNSLLLSSLSLLCVIYGDNTRVVPSVLL